MDQGGSAALDPPYDGIGTDLNLQLMVHLREIFGLVIQTYIYGYWDDLGSQKRGGLEQIQNGVELRYLR